MEFMYCMSSPRGPSRSIIKRVCWERPPGGWCKLNTDGATSGNSGLARCGGIVRDEHGDWLAGFSRHIGITTSFVAELWGLRDGLMLCSNLNISFLVVELDAKAIVDAFQNVHYENNSLPCFGGLQATNLQVQPDQIQPLLSSIKSLC